MHTCGSGSQGGEEVGTVLRSLLSLHGQLASSLEVTNHMRVSDAQQRAYFLNKKYFLQVTSPSLGVFFVGKQALGSELQCDFLACEGRMLKVMDQKERGERLRERLTTSLETASVSEEKLGRCRCASGKKNSLGKIFSFLFFQL